MTARVLLTVEHVLDECQYERVEDFVLVRRSATSPTGCILTV